MSREISRKALPGVFEIKVVRIVTCLAGAKTLVKRESVFVLPSYIEDCTREGQAVERKLINKDGTLKSSLERLVLVQNPASPSKLLLVDVVEADDAARAAVG